MASDHSRSQYPSMHGPLGTASSVDSVMAPSRAPPALHPDFPTATLAFGRVMDGINSEVRSHLHQKGSLPVNGFEEILQRHMMSAVGPISEAATYDSRHKEVQARRVNPASNSQATALYNPSYHRQPPPSTVSQYPSDSTATTGRSPQVGTNVRSDYMFHAPALALDHEASFVAKNDPQNHLGRDFYMFRDGRTSIITLPEEGVSVPDRTVMQRQLGTSFVLEASERGFSSGLSQAPPPPLSQVSTRSCPAPSSASRFVIRNTVFEGRPAFSVKDLSQPHDEYRLFEIPSSHPQHMLRTGAVFNLTHGEQHGAGDGFFYLYTAPGTKPELHSAQEIHTPASTGVPATNQSTAASQATGPIVSSEHPTAVSGMAGPGRAIPPPPPPPAETSFTEASVMPQPRVPAQGPTPTASARSPTRWSRVPSKLMQVLSTDAPGISTATSANNESQMSEFTHQLGAMTVDNSSFQPSMAHSSTGAAPSAYNMI
ncbi:hypothetical protein I316_01958 [Kwoniella heveanensis BCC8398]|uniref:Uncharacterized protein n=1 Tax=Kwoniella heveanensis BCC8398 TaxID=1296120 RepID=A0A1B9GYJ4_9TREE|nr:hypothetical protein I316_01958 [Kwoniella heveanensis BCC8398]